MTSCLLFCLETANGKPDTFYALPPKKWRGIMLYPLKFCVRPSVSAPTIRVPATPPTVLGQSFSNFTGAFRMV